MHTITADSATQLRVSFEDEVANRVPIRGTVHLRVEHGAVHLHGNRWDVYLRRADKFMESPSNSARDIIIGRAIAAATAWVAANTEAMLDAEVENASRDRDRADAQRIEAKIAYEQAIGAHDRAHSAYMNAIEARNRYKEGAK